MQCKYQVLDHRGRTTCAGWMDGESIPAPLYRDFLRALLRGACRAEMTDPEAYPEIRSAAWRRHTHGIATFGYRDREGAIAGLALLSPPDEYEEAALSAYLQGIETQAREDGQPVPCFDTITQQRPLVLLATNRWWSSDTGRREAIVHACALALAMSACEAIETR